MINTTYDTLARATARRPNMWIEQDGAMFSPHKVESLESTDSLVGEFVTRSIIIDTLSETLEGFVFTKPFKLFQEFKNLDGTDNPEGTIELGTFIVDPGESEYDTTKRRFKLVAMSDMSSFRKPTDLKFARNMTPRDIMVQVFKELEIESELLVVPGVTDVVIEELDYNADEFMTYGQFIQAYAYLTFSNAYYDGKVVRYKSILDNHNPYSVDHNDVLGDFGEFESYTLTTLKYDNIEGVNDPVFASIGEGDEFYFTDNLFLRSQSITRIKQSLTKLLDHLVSKVGPQGLQYSTLSLSDVYVNPSRSLGDQLLVTTRDGKEYVSYISEYAWSYTPAMKGMISCTKLKNVDDHYAEMTREEIGFLKMGIDVDRIDKTLTLYINEVGEFDEKLAQIKLEVDKIESSVEGINNGNIIPNLNGQNGLEGWEGKGETVYIPEMEEMEDLRYGHVAIPQDILGAKSKTGMVFLNSGEMITDFGIVIPDSKYSFKGKVGNFKPFIIKTYEYKTMEEEPFKTTTFNFNSPKAYNQLSMTPQAETRYIRLSIDVPLARYNDMVSFTEMMFNRGEPKDWFMTADEVYSYASSSIKQTQEEIELRAEKDDIISTINQSAEQVSIKADKISLEGLTTINEGFKVLENGDVEMVNANVSGTINAIRGEIGNFEIENGVLTFTSPLYSRPYTRADLSAIKNIIMTDKKPNAYELYIYDVSGDNQVNSADYMSIKNYLDGNKPKPKDPQIQSMVQLGNNAGQIKSSTLYDNGKIGVQTLIQADTVTTGNIDTNGLSIDGKSVEVDSNGFLKLV